MVVGTVDYFRSRWYDDGSSLRAHRHPRRDDLCRVPPRPPRRRSAHHAYRAPDQPAAPPLASGPIPGVASPAMRLVVARCEVRYSGRLSAVLPEALRLLMFKSDGSVMVHSDAGGYKPENWMTPPTVIEESDGEIVVRKLGGEDRLDIRLAEIVSDITHDMGEAAALQKDG